MTDLELIACSRQAMNGLISTSKGKMTEHEKSAYKCLHFFCLRIETYKTALIEIQKGKGRYSRNQLTHAENTISDLRKLADDALAHTE